MGGTLISWNSGRASEEPCIYTLNPKAKFCVGFFFSFLRVCGQNLKGTDD